MALGPCAGRCDWNLLGHGPQASHALTGHGDGDDVRMLASCPTLSVAFAQPDLGLPADVLDHLGLFVASPWEMATDRGGRAGRPGAFDQSLAGMGSPGFGHGPLLAPRTRGIFGRDQAQALHQVSWALETGEVATCCHHGDGHRAWHATQSLQGFDPRVHTPGVHVILPCLCEPLEACSRCVHRTDICLQDDVWRRWGADHCREPPEMGRAPGGSAGGAEIVSEQAGFAAKLGGLASAEGLFTGPREITHGFLVHRGDTDRSAITRARQAGPWYGVPAVRCDPVTGLVGHEGGGHHPAGIVFVLQIPLEPGATGASLRDKDEVCGFRWHLAEEWINVTLTCPNGAQGGHCGAMLLGDIRPSNGILVDSHADEACARLRHG